MVSEEDWIIEGDGGELIDGEDDGGRRLEG